MFPRFSPKKMIPLLLAGVFASGCTNNDGNGQVTLGVTDAPVDGAQHVYVSFSGVTLHHEEDGELSFDYIDADGNPVNKQFDLLALQGGLRELLLEDEALPAGKYTWIRLKVNAEADGELDSYIVINDAEYELYVPSGSNSGLKLNTPFDVVENESVDFTIDFDLRKSVHQPKGQTGPLGPVYFLRPSLRLVDSNETGRIVGTLDPAVFTGQSCSAAEVGYAVYAFSGAGVTADDVDGVDPEPVNSVPAVLDNSSYQYTIAFLEPGDYTLAATCAADSDDPEQDDALNFVATATVTVSAGSDTTHNIAP